MQKEKERGKVRRVEKGAECEGKRESKRGRVPILEKKKKRALKTTGQETRK